MAGDLEIYMDELDLQNEKLMSENIEFREKAQEIEKEEQELQNAYNQLKIENEKLLSEEKR